MKHVMRLALAALLGTAWSVLVGAQTAAPGRTVWNGVYTDGQAERATATFGQACARCHTLTADGARPLSGEKFWEGFSQKSVGDLLTYVSANMPNGNGGSLAPGSYNDLVALILKSNGFPSGATELEPEAIADVQIIPKDGPGELPANTLARVVGCLAPKSGADWTITSATAPIRTEKTGPIADDATRPLGTRTTTLKFVLTRLDRFVGQRVAVTGILLGVGGSDGINVSTVNSVAESCP